MDRNESRVPSAAARLALGLVAAALVATGVVALVGVSGGGGGSAASSVVAKSPNHPAATSPSPSPSPSASPTPEVQTAWTGPPSNRLRLHLVKVIGGHITPKSVDATQTGLIFAQNMIYSHTITVYDRRFHLVKTIPDTVNLAKMGYPKYPHTYHGGPVEAGVAPEAKFVYVSNYSMYGPGFVQGHDVCTPADGYSRSFVYRVDVSTLKIDQAIEVGVVPKYVAVTPNDRYVLVTNWCSYTLSIVSVAKGKQVKQIYLGPYPRGIAVDPSSTYAYVAVMGTTSIAKVNLRTFHVHWISGLGEGPRQATMSPDGRYLYVSMNASDDVVKIDLRTDSVIGRVTVGSEPRSMVIAPDGRSLYVVDYGSNTVSKIATRSMRVIQTVPTNANPIGITYDDATHMVWVACYTGTIMVFKDG